MTSDPNWIDTLSSEVEIDGVPWYKWREMSPQWRQEHNLPSLQQYKRGIQEDLKAKEKSDSERRIPSIKRRMANLRF